MNATYKIDSITTTSGHIIVQATALDEKGNPLPNGSLQLLEPAGSKVFAGLKRDDVVKLTLKVTKTA